VSGGLGVRRGRPNRLQLLRSRCSGDAIVISAYENGDVWTDVLALGSDRATRFEAALKRLGITLNAAKNWSFWQTSSGRANLDSLNPEAVAAALREALGSADP
jgi:hypothetical protein